MDSPFIGQIQPFGFNFSPRAWAECSGALLPISSHQSLFALIGTFYGGDGRTTMGLPDLRGRVPMHFGNGPGLTPRPIGQSSGFEVTTLTAANLPANASQLHALEKDADSTDPNGRMLAKPTTSGSPVANDPIYATRENGDAIVSLDSASITSSGHAQSFNNMQPYQAVNYCIALQGLFPSRN